MLSDMNERGDAIFPPDLGRTTRDVSSHDMRCILDSTAQLLSSAHGGDLPEITCAFFRNALTGTVEIQHNSVFEFRRGRQPKVLFCAGGGYDNDLRIYQRGMYLLDPYFDLFENQKRTGIFHFSAASRDNLEAPEFVEQYWHLIGLNNEVGGLYPVSTDCCIHVAIQFSTDDDVSVSRAISLARASQTILNAAFRVYHSSSSGEDDGDDLRRRNTHEKVSETLRHFGEGILSERERTLVQLMLKGYSAKAMARILDISPGTISVHRSNIYRKMQVSSLGEIFGKFLGELVETEAQ